MRPTKNLRDRLANQSGMPTSGGIGGGARSDGGLNKLIEAERAKHRDAAAGGDTGEVTRKKANTSVPSRQAGPKGGPGAARGANKSTTNQGLR